MLNNNIAGNKKVLPNSTFNKMNFNIKLKENNG